MSEFTKLEVYGDDAELIGTVERRAGAMVWDTTDPALLEFKGQPVIRRSCVETDGAVAHYGEPIDESQPDYLDCLHDTLIFEGYCVEGYNHPEVLE